MRLLVGIGNPGDEYAGTRHNVGFDVVERVAARNRCALERDRRLNARVGRCRVGADEVLLLEPLSYVNLSGPVVAKVCREREIPLSGLLVVSDDYHLPLGTLRVRQQGSAGGHNGLRSLIDALGTDAFCRLRVGIGEAPPGGSVDFVLTRFRPSERPVMEDALERAADCAETWAREGAGTAMNRFNG